MALGLKKRWELNGRLLEAGNKIIVKYNPAEHLHICKEFEFNGDVLVSEGFTLSPDSIFIDEMFYVNPKQ